MDKLKKVLHKNSDSKREIIENEKEFEGIKVIDTLQSIEEQRVVVGYPKVVEEGLLLPFTYVKTIHDNKPIDTLYYLLINKSVLKQVAQLIREYDDGK